MLQITLNQGEKFMNESEQKPSPDINRPKCSAADQMEDL